ncbi:MAG: TonB-dependent receptor [Maricaulaceae bacterium]
MNRQTITRAFLLSASLAAISTTSFAQSEPTDEVIATGIRQSLENALIEKREAASLVEIILAEDIGKLPDQNLAEVLENVTGVQITRTAGVGTGVQIRGTNSNRVEINGVSTLDSGSGRGGINFEDVNSSIIAGVEVIKVPEAKTIEGSVGGTINLRTIRPLDLDKPLIAARIQGEDSSLSTEGIQPRFSAALGNKWSTGAGDIGIVVSGSYTEQEAVSFRPRADRDNLTTVNDEQFLAIQFLLQEAENEDFETINIAGTAEWEPNDELNLYVDVFYNDQQNSQDQYRLQASGVSALAGVTTPTSTELVDFSDGLSASQIGGLTDVGFGPGIIPASLTGTIEPNLGVDDDDPNLRFSSETAARVTESSVIAFGGEWERDNWTVSAQYARSDTETETPQLDVTLNFFNPNCPGDGSSNDNCVPFIFDLSDETLAFGINFASPFAPTPAQLLDPSNVVFDQAIISDDRQENTEDALRFDVSYDLEDSFLGNALSSIDVGYRYNETTSLNEDFDDNIGGFSQLEDSPNGSLFAELLIPGPDNFGDADGRELFISNFLLVDPDRAFSDREGTIAILEEALAANRLLNPQADGELTSEPTLDTDAFFDVTEETHAIYGQVNFESGIFRGNIGGRYVNTDVTSTGVLTADGDGNITETISFDGSYDFFLPRFNLRADLTDTLVARAGYASDILRPSFNNLGGFSFSQSENAAVQAGNPALQPETVDSIDFGLDWYFAPSSVFSVNVFEKTRTNIFSLEQSFAALIDGPTATGFVTTQGAAREIDPTCPGGGIFNPEVVPNVLGDPELLGLCVDSTQVENDAAQTTQRGVEVAFQGDLSSFEDRLGWASGFGLQANYTYQEFSGGSATNEASGRGSAVLGELTLLQGLPDFSENAYNITGYYEKFGLSARLRYTWRDEFRTFDFGGGANTSGSSTFGFPVITESRGQFNGSVSYDITDNFTVGVEGVNLTEANVVQRAVTAEGPIAFVGLPDRRIIFGGSYRF